MAPQMPPAAGEGPGHIYTELGLAFCLRMLMRPKARSSSNSPVSVQHLNVTGKWVTNLSLGLP